MRYSALSTAVAVLLFTGGHAAPAFAAQVIDTTGWAPTSGAGTPITLAGAASPQYRYTSFSLNPLNLTYDIVGQSGATIAYPGSSTYQSVLGTAFTTGIGFSVLAGDYGLLFTANGVNYSGTATVTATGTISRIVYDVLPVPEPATWAMMLVGFAAIGVSVRRRAHLLTVA